MFTARSCHKQRMTNRFTFRKALSADQFEEMFPDDEACAEDLFRRRWPDGFVCPDCESRNALRPPVPRLLEADGGGRDVHAPLACFADELASSPPHHDRAFELHFGFAVPAPSGIGELQVGLAAGAEDLPGDGSRRRVSADRQHLCGRDDSPVPRAIALEHSLSRITLQ